MTNCAFLGSHPVRLKVDVYHYRILVNTNTLETIPIHPAYILRFRVFQFYECFISISSKSWLPFLNSLLILPFLLMSFHFPSFLLEFLFIWRSYFYLIVFFFIENHPCFSFLPPLPLFLPFDLLLEGFCKRQMVLGSCYVGHVTIFYVFSIDLSFCKTLYGNSLSALISSRLKYHISGDSNNHLLS